jgi:ABC-type polysaccharide/polyol phosphate transport system ATPase subunit
MPGGQGRFGDAKGDSMTAIRFDQVSKRFILRRDRPRSFQELFLDLIRFKGSFSREPMWALRDVSFTIEPGEVVGLIGPNGAGKSTALKLMARILEPTSGSIEINGQVGALLELGAGFHHELTGRENVYLNGSLLGFSRSKMERIFTEILRFSEMERFIDVPVKHYSSGMYMRLAFSIAINIEPDVLLVDEVLAVGDQAFQMRCLDRIDEMRRRGIAIVLVTHELDTVRELCHRAIWLDDGQIQAEGSVDLVLQRYTDSVYARDEEHSLGSEQETIEEGEEGEEEELSWRWGSREGEILGVQILDSQGVERKIFRTGDTLVVRLYFDAKQRIEEPMFGLAFYHSNGCHISGPNTVFSGVEIEAIEGKGYIDYIVDSLPLLEGSYLVSASLYDYKGVYCYDFHHLVYGFRVRPSEATKEKYGMFLIPSRWRLGF